MKKTAQNLIISVLFLFISFSILEISLRLYLYLKFNLPFFNRIDYKVYDQQLAWKGREVMGDTLTKKFKIFFVGDSFTEGCGLKTENMYYSIIKNKLDVEIFVYAGKGYGTLQEYLVIDRYIDGIRPDLIVLQVCANDFINNVWALESTSYLNNNDMLRPYYENGKIQYRFPRGPVFLKKFIIPYSRTVYFISKVTNRFLAMLAKKGFIRTVESEITERGIELEQFKESILTTSELMYKIKRRCGELPLVAFSVDETEPYFNQFRLIFKNTNIEFIEEPPKIIYAAKRRGIKLVLKNNHWNEKGHRIIGEYLTDYFKSKNIISRQSVSLRF